MYNREQMIQLLSQSMWIGHAYGQSRLKEDFNEEAFKNYARGMINNMLENTCLEDVYVTEESIAEFLRKFSL